MTDRGPKVNIWLTSGFWPRVRAPIFLGSLTRHTGRCAPPPPIAASLLLFQPPKINKMYQTRAASLKGFPEIKCFPSGSNLGLSRQGLFSFHWNTEALIYEVPCPPPRPSQLRWSFQQYFGIKIMYRCDFLFKSSYPSLLISVGSNVYTGVIILFFSSYLFLFFSSYLFLLFSFNRHAE